MDYNPAAELGVFFEPNHYKFILKYDFKPYFDKKKRNNISTTVPFRTRIEI